MIKKLLELRMRIQKEDIQISYGSPYSKIEANLLLTSLFHNITIIEEINRELGNEYKLNINIKAFKEGSFEVHLEVLGGLITAISAIGTDNISMYLSNIINIFRELLELKRILKGEKPDKIEELDEDKFKITNSDGFSITVNKNTYHIYADNLTVNQAINENFELLSEYSDIKEFQIKKKGNTIFTATRDEFQNLAENNKLLEDKEIKFKDEFDVHLVIVKLVLDGNRKRKWEFLYNGIKISAKILDQDFFDRIDRREEGFLQGDILVCDLRIEQSFNKKLEVWENTGNYFILKVKKHISKGFNQKEIDFT